MGVSLLPWQNRCKTFLITNMDHKYWDGVAPCDSMRNVCGARQWKFAALLLRVPIFKHTVRVRFWFRHLFSRAVRMISDTHERNRANMPEDPILFPCQSEVCPCCTHQCSKKKRVPAVHAEGRDPFITVTPRCVSTETRFARDRRWQLSTS